MIATPYARRLFFALWPTAELRNQLLERMAPLTNLQCKPMLPDNLHVTLVFLGAVPAERVAELVTLAQGIKLPACELCLDRLAIWKQARVLVLTASHTPSALQQHVGELQKHLHDLGFTVDSRPFRPHVTLARDVRAPASEAATEPLMWTATDYVLVESVSTATGVHYQVLATINS